jgi:anti-anti-sigma factor
VSTRPVAGAGIWRATRGGYETRGTGNPGSGVPFTSRWVHSGAGEGHFVANAPEEQRVRAKIDTAGASGGHGERSAGDGMRTTAVDDRSAAHACAVPVSDEQLWEMTAAFLAAGLRAGEQVVYFDDGTVEAVLDRLVDDRVAIGRPLSDGQLTVVGPERTRAALRAPLRDTAAGLATMIDEALAAGYSGFRWTGQLSYGLQRVGGLWLADYDGVIDAVLAGRAARALCFYDRRRFPDDAITQLRARHRVELDAPSLYDDNLLRVTRVRPFRLRMAGEVDHSNRPVLHRLVASTLDEALRSHDAPAVVEIDLASLRFLDVAGAIAFVHAAEEFPQSHRLVLTAVRPAVLRVLDRCGAPFAAQLEVTAHPGPGLPGVPRRPR